PYWVCKRWEPRQSRSAIRSTYRQIPNPPARYRTTRRFSARRDNCQREPLRIRYHTSPAPLHRSHLMLVGNMWVQAGKYLPRKLCRVAYIHFATNSGPVCFYGSLRHANLGSRDLIWQTACDKKENLFFTRRQALYEDIQPRHV